MRLFYVGSCFFVIDQVYPITTTPQVACDESEFNANAILYIFKKRTRTTSPQLLPIL
jgi:hypothetical protein